MRLLLALLFPAIAFAGNPATANTGQAYCGSNEIATVKYAVIDEASSGDNTVVAAVTGRKIRVLSYVLIPTGDVVVRFESGAGGTALTGQINLLEEDGLVTSSVNINCSPHGCFETAAGALLNLELSAAVSVDGHLTYIECR